LAVLLAERRARAGEWMKPDFADLMPELAAAGRRSVLVAPVQFLADHLEILYDVDIGAREGAEACGVAFHGIASLSADPALAPLPRSPPRRLMPSGPGVVQGHRCRA